MGNPLSYLRVKTVASNHQIGSSPVYNLGMPMKKIEIEKTAEIQCIRGQPKRSSSSTRSVSSNPWSEQKFQLLESMELRRTRLRLPKRRGESKRCLFGSEMAQKPPAPDGHKGTPYRKRALQISPRIRIQSVKRHQSGGGKITEKECQQDACFPWDSSCNHPRSNQTKGKRDRVGVFQKREKRLCEVPTHFDFRGGR